MLEHAHLVFNLIAIATFSAGAVAVLWRHGKRRNDRQDTMVLGYPPDRFPAHEVVHHAALQTLAAAQARLLGVYDGLPTGSDSAKRMHVFLLELRRIMDVAYEVALITRAYGQLSQLDTLVSEVQQIEAQLTQQVIHRLLAHEADAQEELLNTRLEVLRTMVRGNHARPGNAGLPARRIMASDGRRDTR